MTPSIPAAFALAAILLCLNLLGLWMYSAVVRSKTGVVANPEDAKMMHATASPDEPEPVARVMRAHANAQATIFPFLTLALVYVLLGSSATLLWIVGAVFVVARYVHSFAYLQKLQPWRTIAFLTGMVASLVLMIADLIAL